MLRSPLIVLAASLVLFTSVAYAQDHKPAPLPPGDLFFTAKGKHPMALERYHPGLVAALLLTDEQKLALAEASRKTIMDEDLRAAAMEVKSNANATEVQRENVRMLQEAARDKLDAVIEQILKPDQKALISKIQQAFDDAAKAAMRDMEGEFGQAKGDEKRTAAARDAYQATLKDEFAKRLDAIFTPEQKAAVQQAAKAQAEQEARAAQSKKGK